MIYGVVCGDDDRGKGEGEVCLIGSRYEDNEEDEDKEEDEDEDEDGRTANVAGILKTESASGLDNVERVISSAQSQYKEKKKGVWKAWGVAAQLAAA